MQDHARLDVAELTLLAAIWGASFLFLRLGAPAFGPLALAFVRVAGAGLFLLPLLAWQGGRITGEEILQDQSIMRSSGSDLTVSLQVPEAVLTGQRYDVDLIVDPAHNETFAAQPLQIVGTQRE